MRYLSLLLVLFVCTCVRAQCVPATGLEAQARTAYLNNDAQAWAEVLAAAQELPATPENQLLLARLAFGASGAAMASEKMEGLDDILDIMEAAIDNFWEHDKQHPVASGLYSGYLGLRIAKSPMKGMIYGGKASKYAKKGVGYDENSPEAQYFLGSNLFYTPTTWGGDPEQAVQHLQAASEATPPAEACGWFHLQTLALLGQAQAETGDTEGARQTYLKALQLEPQFYYVSKVLMPALSK